mmetsp:Transcript_20755/g.29229  ORF Transcript_20755/g.29229 Transcript_20755/m.29229 type:complete len:242 (+) Transcript_20755:1907-2632(+)
MSEDQKQPEAEQANGGNPVFNLTRVLKLLETPPDSASLASPDGSLSVHTQSPMSCEEQIRQVPWFQQGVVNALASHFGSNVDESQTRTIKDDLMAIYLELCQLHKAAGTCPKSHIRQKLTTVQNGLVFAKTFREVMYTKLFLLLECYQGVVKSDVFARLAGIGHSERRLLLGPVAEAILNCDLLRTDAVEMAKFFFSIQDAHAKIMAEVGLTMPDQTSETGATAAFLGSVSTPPAPGTSER